MNKLICGLTVFLSVALAGSWASAQSFKEGEWTMTMVTKMDGMDEQMAEAMAAMEGMSPEEKAMMNQMMGSMNVQMGIGSEGVTTTVIQCLTGQDPIPQMDKDENCDVTHTQKGDTVEFEAVCPKGISKGKMTYSDDTVKGVITTDFQDGKDGGRATIKVDGKYNGPCP